MSVDREEYITQADKIPEHMADQSIRADKVQKLSKAIKHVKLDLERLDNEIAEANRKLAALKSLDIECVDLRVDCGCFGERKYEPIKIITANEYIDRFHELRQQ